MATKKRNIFIVCFLFIIYFIYYNNYIYSIFIARGNAVTVKIHILFRFFRSD